MVYLAILGWTAFAGAVLLVRDTMQDLKQLQEHYESASWRATRAINELKTVEEHLKRVLERKT